MEDSGFDNGEAPMDVCEPKAAFGDVIGSRHLATLDPTKGTQVPIPLCCTVIYARTHANPCEKPPAPLARLGSHRPGHWPPGGPVFPSFSRLVVGYHRPETPGRRLDTCATSLICGHHMSPSTHLATLPFPSCRCHPVTTTWKYLEAYRAHSARAGHSVSSVRCLGDIILINYLPDSFISST